MRASASCGPSSNPAIAESALTSSFLRSQGQGRRSRLEYLDAMIGGVGDVDRPGGLIDEDAVQVAELAVARARGAPHGQKLAGLVEHLNAVVRDLGDVDIVVLVEGDAGPRPQLARAAAAPADRAD